MLNPFLKYYKEKLKINPSQKVLLAVSGGIDSMVMLYLFRAANIPIAVAHVNFKLRKNESEGDALFVKQTCEKASIPFYTTQFETQKIATDRKQSIQLVARDLRYEWLEKIRVENQFDFIATAHHLNDSIETAIYNFTKGTGIRGLTGIPPIRNQIIRPLLFASKDTIEKYSASFEIQFREDASNTNDKYARNLIRHQVIPTLQELNPALENTARKNFDKLNEVSILFEERIAQIKNEVMTSFANGDVEFDLAKIKKHTAQKTILYECISPFGFNEDQVIQMLKTTDTKSGRQFLTVSHRAVLNRDKLIVTTIPSTNNRLAEVILHSPNEKLDLGDGVIYVETTSVIPTKFEKHLAYLDLGKLDFPLKFRRWQAGDNFQPFGMNGQQQKLKDFFVNNKFSLLEKEKVWILESAGTICWIVGHRVDHRVCVQPQTTEILVLHYTFI